MFRKNDCSSYEETSDGNIKRNRLFPEWRKAGNLFSPGNKTTASRSPVWMRGARPAASISEVSVLPTEKKHFQFNLRGFRLTLQIQFLFVSLESFSVWKSFHKQRKVERFLVSEAENDEGDSGEAGKKLFKENKN